MEEADYTTFWVAASNRALAFAQCAAHLEIVREGYLGDEAEGFLDGLLAAEIVACHLAAATWKAAHSKLLEAGIPTPEGELPSAIPWAIDQAETIELHPGAQQMIEHESAQIADLWRSLCAE